MVYFKWLSLFIVDKIFLIVSLPMYPLLSLFTSKHWPSWGSWFWTYDNPPQGDDGWQTRRAPFTPASTPFELYINRVMWLYRNPNYGFNKLCSVGFDSGLSIVAVSTSGAGLNISDKYKASGWYFVKCFNEFEDVVAFEFYAVLPYSKNHDVRIRLGWKLVTDKFKDSGFAPLVGTINPFDGYGN